ncbi:MAG: ThuA domain-containing protein [Anaerolineaceae bacterium]|nr:ThuA domain-containing protein [Anaerolineaceae bacterium]
MSKPARVTVWNEFRHEKDDSHVASQIYPDGMHEPIASWLRQQGMDVGTATLDEPEHGLTQDVLDNTDVLIWWGHLAHHEVSDEVVDRVQLRVLSGMGLVVLHSGHHSRVFRRLMGTTGHLKWREADERERIWVVEPGHPIAAGIDRYIELDRVEMYGERFDIPAPDTLVFISWFEGGNVFRSGCCWNRGRGRIFYFRPGHESFPHFHNEQILRVISNAVNWAVADNPGFDGVANERESLEPISAKD